jgi:hypothetical protein
MSELLAFARLLPAPAGWIVLALLVALLGVIGLLTSVIHAHNDDPADRLCKVIRAWRGLPAKPKTGALGRKRKGINGAGLRRRPR